MHAVFSSSLWTLYRLAVLQLHVTGGFFHEMARRNDSAAAALSWDPVQDSHGGSELFADQGNHLHERVPNAKVDIFWLCSRLRAGRYDSPVIDLSNQEPTREELDALSHALADNKSVRTLRVSHCALWSTDVRILTYFLVRNTWLRTLDLSHNVITSSGCRAICEALTHNTTLKHLLLSANSIGNEGLLCLVALLEGAAPGPMLKASRLNVKKDNYRSRNGKKNGHEKDPAYPHKEEEETQSESGLRVVAVDENAIDDRNLISHFQELCKQQNPGSVHFELKQVKEEMRDSVETIATLRGKIHAQAKELKLLRGTGAKGFSSRWGKLKSAVMLGNAKTKKAKSKRKGGKKGIKRRVKR